MIVKNGEKYLKTTLPPLVEVADEVIFIDTGSNDKSIEIAKSLGAKVSSIKWQDDFAQARNESIKTAKGKWIIWIDADEYITKEDLKALKKIIEKSDANAYYMPIYDCKFKETIKEQFYSRLKLFRNFKGYQFARAFNEGVVNKEGKAPQALNLKEFPIYHWGKKTSEEETNQKIIRNISILEKVIKDNPSDANQRWLLGINYYCQDNFEKAAQHFIHAIKFYDNAEMKSKSQLMLGKCYLKLGQTQAATEFIKEAVRTDLKNTEAINTLADMVASKDFNLAIKLLNISLITPMPESANTVVHKKHYDFVPNFYLGQIFLKQGDKNKAIEYFHKAKKIDANDEELKDYLKKNNLFGAVYGN